MKETRYKGKIKSKVVVKQKNGLNNFKSLRLTDLGLEKNKTELNQKTIDRAYEKAEVIY